MREFRPSFGVGLARKACLVGVCSLLASTARFHTGIFLI